MLIFSETLTKTIIIKTSNLVFVNETFLIKMTDNISLKKSCKMVFNGNIFENNDDKIKSFTIEEKHFNIGSTSHQTGSSLNHRQINENVVLFLKIYKLDSLWKLTSKSTN